MGVAGAATALALLVPGAAMAKGPGGGGGGGGGGHTPSEVSHSLSVPAVFVGANPYGLTCDGMSVAPETDPLVPLSGYELSPSSYYYVQGVHSWRASCLQDYTAATVDAEWGDNLAGDAKLKVGSPIRVEIGLLVDEMTELPELTGWEVVKLEPSQLDRVSAYGTLATATEGGYVSSPTTSLRARVWAAGSTLTIMGPDSFLVAVPASAEINATGKIVYGHNLRVPAMGEYTITYTFPGVTIDSTDAGTVIQGDAGDSVSLTITVGSGGGGGGGGGNRPW